MPSPPWRCSAELLMPVMRLIGDTAKNQVARNSENIVFVAKRLIGRKFNEPHVQSDILRWPFKVNDVFVTVPAYFNDLQRQATSPRPRVPGMGGALLATTAMHFLDYDSSVGALCATLVGGECVHRVAQRDGPTVTGAPWV